MVSAVLRMGTRGSPLALRQAQALSDLLAATHPELALRGAIETVVVRTSGDRMIDRSLAEVGGKGLFVKEIEEALLAGSIDLAVHSMKDVPTRLPDRLAIGCYLKREDPRDAFLSLLASSLAALPQGASVGTSSLRRKAQLLYARPDLRILPLRGNVDTRLRKLADGVVDATLLAFAGLKRLEKEAHATVVLAPDEMLPAPAQGAIGVEIRADDARARRYLAPLDDAATALCVTAERALLAALDGSCRTPIAALATLAGDRLVLDGMIIAPDGRARHQHRCEGDKTAAEAIGFAAGETLRSRAGPGFFAGLAR